MNLDFKAKCPIINSMNLCASSPMPSAVRECSNTRIKPSAMAIVHPEGNQDGETLEALCALNTGPRQLRCIFKEGFRWTQILAFSHSQKCTKIINLRYLFFVISSYLLLRCMLDCTYSLAKTLTGFCPTSLDHFPQSCEVAVSQPRILSKTLNKTQSHNSCVFL